MARSDKITLIIHGPLSIYTTFMLYRYYRDYPIIIVIPKTIPEKAELFLKEIQRMMADKDYQVSLFMYDESLPNNAYNDQNRYYHFLSVHLGLTACSTDYAVKVRSDEFYSDLTPFVNAVMDSNDKIVTSDVFFRNSTIPYHPSDHLVGGATKEMLEMFRLAREFSENQEQRESNVLIKHCKATKTPFGVGLLTAEQQMGCAAITLQYSTSKLEKISVVEAMIERFFIVPCSELGVFRIGFNSNSKEGPKEYIDESYFNVATDIKDINDYK